VETAGCFTGRNDDLVVPLDGTTGILNDVTTSKVTRFLLMNKLIILLPILLCLLMPASAYADFEDIGIGARPVAMGGAFTGLADDANSIYYNPAGLGMLTRQELTGEESWLFLGLSDGSRLFNGFIGYVHPVSKTIGTFGAGWLSTSLRDNDALIGGNKETFIRYAENAFIFSYARDITDFTGRSLGRLTKVKDPLPGKIAAGLNVKLMAKSFGMDDYTMEAVSASGISLMPDPVFGSDGSRNTKYAISCDLGLFYKLESQRLSFGMALTDINKPYTVLDDNSINSNSLCRLPAGLRLGCAYREPATNMVFDIRMRGADLDFHSGIEKWFHGTDMALRAGFNHGSRFFNNITLGACYKYVRRYQFDYVFIYPLSGLRNIMGSHRLSITMQFGEMTQESEIRRQAELATEGINKLKKEKKEKLIRFDYLRNKFMQRIKK